MYMSSLPNCGRPRTYLGWDEKRKKALIGTMCEHKKQVNFINLRKKKNNTKAPIDLLSKGAFSLAVVLRLELKHRSIPITRGL